MIRLVQYLNQKDPELDESIMRFLILTENSFLVRFDKDIVGALAFHGDSKEVYLSIYFLEHIEFERMHRCLSFVTEKIIEKFHPHKIIIIDAMASSIPTLVSCGYYSSGKNYQKIIETMRYQLKDSVFDNEGYIIDQGLMKDIPFGFFNTKDKGCGWIAIFNLLKMAGYEQTMAETRDDLERMSAFGEWMGQPVYSMYLYLKSLHIPVKWAAGRDKKITEKMKKSRFGILAYTHNKGAHYTSYRSLGDGRVHFYNAIYGRSFHKEAPERFLAKHSLLKASILLYIE